MLKQLEELGKVTVENAWKASKIMKSLYGNSEFIAHCGGRGEVDERLDRHAADFALTIGDMLTMIRYFPNKSQWKGRTLRMLKQESIEKARKESERKNENNKTTKGEESSDGRTHWKVKYKVLKKNYDEALQRIAVLEARNEELERMIKLISDLRGEDKDKGKKAA